MTDQTTDQTTTPVTAPARSSPPRPLRSPGAAVRSALVLAVDVVIPLAAFYGARAAGADQWTALFLAALAPLGGIATTWLRARRLDTMALLVIAVLVLSVIVAVLTGDPRTLLARESGVTGLIGLWTIASLVLTRPFLLDVVIKTSRPVVATRIAMLWSTDTVFHRWFVVASWAWGACFLLDAAARVTMAYTLPVDTVPALGVVTLVALLIVAQSIVMLHGWRTGVLALLRTRRRA